MHLTIGIGVLFEQLLVLMGILGTAAIPRSCTPGWVRYGDSCYKGPSKNKFSWVEAFKICQSLGAHLIVPNSLDEKRFIAELAKKQKREHAQLWLGCQEIQIDEERCYGTDDGLSKILDAPRNYTCLATKITTLKFTRIGCTKNRRVMCERQQQSQNAIHCFAATDPEDDKALPNCLLDHAYMEIPILHPMQCCIACYKDPDCHSFNLSGKMCQLNNVTISQVGDRFLTKNQDCAYYELE